MFVQYDLTHINVCCNSSLCNSMHQDLVVKNACESNRTHQLQGKNIAKLLSIPNMNAQNVTECYYCDNCVNETMASIISCNNYSSVSTSCVYSYFYENQTKYWSGNCIDTVKFSFLSYSNGREGKAATCQKNLCNSPSNMKYLDLTSTFLCENGFYGYAKNASIRLNHFFNLNLMLIIPLLLAYINVIKLY
jgi:hypothetical protein